jgi:hypothetical protein
MAEELVARRYLELGDATSAALFRSGTRARARRYLASTDSVSLIVSTGQGTLAERGGGFLFVLYLEDQVGLDLLGRLTTTTRTGVGNVEAEIGRDWEDIVADWWSAIYLDGPGPSPARGCIPTSTSGRSWATSSPSISISWVQTARRPRDCSGRPRRPTTSWSRTRPEP